MPCPRCGSDNVHDQGKSIIDNAHTATHFGLHYAKHSLAHVPMLGLIVIGGLWAANVVLEQLVDGSKKCGSCSHTF